MLAAAVWAQRLQGAKRVLPRGLAPEHRRAVGPAGRPTRRSAAARPCPPSAVTHMNAGQP